jgi:GTP-binding protein
MNARYLCSAAYFEQFPSWDTPEFCLLGRSNVGKSSFINHVFHNNTLARVSKTPGKTALANFFGVDDGTVWVDLPGYGFAKTSREEMKRLSNLVVDYCEKRKNLCGILWLLDIRHPGSEADIEIAGRLNSLGLPLLPILTKSDKITSNRARILMREYGRCFGFRDAPVPYSILSEPAREEFCRRYAQWVQSVRPDGEKKLSCRDPLIS